MATIQMVYKFVECNGHNIHHHCQETHNKYYLLLIVVAMATIVIDYT